MKLDKKVIAITFARAGSKGIPNKNIKMLVDKPLLGHAITSAKACSYIDGCFVSTDGNEIKQVAEAYEATVINRPEALSSDTANEWDAWQHAVSHLVEGGVMALDDVFVSVPCTSPLRTSEDITKIVDSFLQSDCDLALGICEADRNPYFNMVTQNKSGEIDVVCNATTYIRRQDVPEVWNITTVAYVTTPRFILNNQGVLAGKTLGVEIDKAHSIDIDTSLDFEFAEFLMTKLQHHQT